MTLTQRLSSSSNLKRYKGKEVKAPRNKLKIPKIPKIQRRRKLVKVLKKARR